MIKWDVVTREERHYTNYLFHDIKEDSKPFLDLLKSKVSIPVNVTVMDVGYEVCYFRDIRAYERKLGITLPRISDKQTFDLVIWLSDSTMIIIEAKAQQSFSKKQTKILHENKKVIMKPYSSKFPIPKVYIIGLCSSNYTTKVGLDAIIHWSEIAICYPKNEEVRQAYLRADSIHRK